MQRRTLQFVYQMVHSGSVCWTGINNSESAVFCSGRDGTQEAEDEDLLRKGIIQILPAILKV